MNQPTTPPRGVSMPTVVLGLLLGAVAATALVRETLGYTVDLEAAAPLALLAAGALLVLWAVVGLARQQSRRAGHDGPDSTDQGSDGDSDGDADGGLRAGQPTGAATLFDRDDAAPSARP